MFLILLLFAIAIIALGIVFGIASVGGAVFIVVFGDVIVCVVFIIWLIRKIINKKN
jgi:hypothetical protein